MLVLTAAPASAFTLPSPSPAANVASSDIQQVYYYHHGWGWHRGWGWHGGWHRRHCWMSSWGWRCGWW
jgi:hypothetical protein